ncbi:TetR/AcrR family transcriptional regulator [Novosphingobium soli]|uniref:TetR/AcrR family transcriptional regulator n=1 Tax=Novosphingobium soli TaxID=574956 RepID=A0ABV6CQ74_9SPHN
MASDGTTERTRTARSLARRQHLLDTARNLFVERGFHQTGMAQIASASGIAVGQIYRDFANKEAIVAAICEADLVGWLEEARLQAAVEAGNTQAILEWVERIGTDEPSPEDRRLMCELLAEVGRNPIIEQVNGKVEARVRASLEAALKSIAPAASERRRSTMMDFIMTLAWGIMARIELAPGRDHADLRGYAAALLRRELAALDA